MRTQTFALAMVVIVLSGCRDDASKSNLYPQRPSATPYYYNETSFREIDQNVGIASRRARTQTGIEFVTVILKNIPANMPIGEYAAGLFTTWHIGTQTNGKGVLILFVESTHTLKIEVSYYLEGVFTDAFCSEFQPTIKSYYAGKYFGDVFCNMINCMVKRIVDGPDYTPKINTKTLSEYSDRTFLDSLFLSGGAGIIDDKYFYEKDSKLSFIQSISKEKIREFDSARDVEMVLTRYFKMLEDGINYPFLGMLTEGSQMMCLEYPHSAYFCRSRWKDYQRALPYKIVFKGDLAAVRFKNAQPLPIFLRRTTDGFWKIDVSKSWANSWIDFANNKSGPVHTDHPWMFAFPECGQEKSCCNVPNLLPLDAKIRLEIKRLEAAIKQEPSNASNYFKLADIFYWECYWLRSAIDVAEKGLELQPDNVPYRWLVIEMRQRFPCPQVNRRHFEKLLKLNPDSGYAFYGYSQHCWYYTMEYEKAVDLLHKARNARQEAAYNDWKYKHYLNLYKKNYWEEVAIDKNPLWAFCNYVYIFYLPFNLTSGLLTLALAIMGITILIIRAKKIKAGLTSVTNRQMPDDIKKSFSANVVPWQIWVVIAVLGFKAIDNLLYIPHQSCAIAWLAFKILSIIGLLRGWKWVYILFLVIVTLHLVYHADPKAIMGILADLLLIILSLWAFRYYFPEDTGSSSDESL